MSHFDSMEFDETLRDRDRCELGRLPDGAEEMFGRHIRHICNARKHVRFPALVKIISKITHFEKTYNIFFRVIVTLVLIATRETE